MASSSLMKNSNRSEHLFMSSLLGTLSLSLSHCPLRLSLVFILYLQGHVARTMLRDKERVVPREDIKDRCSSLQRRFLISCTGAPIRLNEKGRDKTFKRSAPVLNQEPFLSVVFFLDFRFLFIENKIHIIRK